MIPDSLYFLLSVIYLKQEKCSFCLLKKLYCNINLFHQSYTNVNRASRRL